MKIDLDSTDQSVLFAIFDRVRYSWGTMSDHEDLMIRLETELNRFGEQNEQTTTTAAKTQ